MIRNIAIAALGLIALAVGPATQAEEKKQMLAVSFATPNPNYKAAITKVMQVGDELWVKVEVSSAGRVAPAVISKAKAKLTIEAPEAKGGIKYVGFGKNWGWKNEEKEITFLADLDDKARAEWEKKFDGGTVVYPAKK